MASTLDKTNADLEKQIDQTQDETVDISRNIKSLALQTQDVGNSTMVELERQGEKLNEANAGMDRIHVQAQEAQQNLDELDKCCGLCICPWNRYRGPKTSMEKAKDSGHDNKAGPIKSQPKIETTDLKMKKVIEGDKREDEIAENLNVASNVMDNLHQMALDMGNEISAQNQTLEEINRKGEINKEAIQSATDHANKHLEK